jgi:hypothetical protein
MKRVLLKMVYMMMDYQHPRSCLPRSPHLSVHLFEFVITIQAKLSLDIEQCPYRLRDVKGMLKSLLTLFNINATQHRQSSTQHGRTRTLGRN